MVNWIKDSEAFCSLQSLLSGSLTQLPPCLLGPASQAQARYPVSTAILPPAIQDIGLLRVDLSSPKLPYAWPANYIMRSQRPETCYSLFTQLMSRLWTVLPYRGAHSNPIPTFYLLKNQGHPRSGQFIPWASIFRPVLDKLNFQTLRPLRSWSVLLSK